MKFKGLTRAQVIANRKKFGTNEIPMPAPKSAWYFFKEVFEDKINLILLIMLGLFVGLSVMGVGDLFEAAGIAIVLFIVSAISVVTKLRTQSSARALQRAAGAHSCRVIRDGKIHNIDSSQIVIDDLIQISAGEIICADGYIIDGAVAVNNSILNGESDEASKAPIRGYKYNPTHKIGADDYTDRNSLFAGTTVQSGEGIMRVTRIGAATQNAQIMTTLADIDEVRTSLQIQIDNIATKISKIGTLCAIVVCIVLIIMSILSGTLGSGAAAVQSILRIVMIALTLFVAAVPEGLPFIINIIISRNTHMMIKNNILAKNPAKIPAAGNLHIICTDKTGTLTVGKMSIEANYLGNGDIMQGTDFATQLFTKSAVLNNSAQYDTDNKIVGGNSTDRAILAAVSASDAHKIQKAAKVYNRVPFNSSNKFALTTARIGDDDITMVSGAPEIILAQCTKYIDANGRERKINHNTVHKIICDAAGNSMRVVAFAYRNGRTNDEQLPTGLTLICVSALRDTVRPDVPRVIHMLGRAKIQVMMITGDNIDTARTIATECEIITSPDDIVILADVLDAHTDTWIKQNMARIKVIARATPATKLRVVTLAQSLNKSIGMCGDGTNDAPALRRADVGFAMGDGTDVCKEASDIIITDNNFVSVANCVLIGRTFLHNVVSFLRFQLPINFSLIVLCLMFPILFGFDALCAVQILIINIVMDSLNSLAFGGEPPHTEYMNSPAPRKDAPLLSRFDITQIAITTVMFLMIFGLMAMPAVRNMFPGEDAYMGARFALLVIMAIFNGFNIRTDGYNLMRGLGRNPMFIYIALGVIAGTVLCIEFGGAALQTASLSLTQWAAVVGLAALIIPMDLLRKFIMQKIRR